MFWKRHASVAVLMATTWSAGMMVVGGTTSSTGSSTLSSTRMLETDTDADLSNTTNPTEDDVGCCSQSYLSCDVEVTWCGATRESCESCIGSDDGRNVSDFIWLENGALPEDSCIGRWTECAGNRDGCCAGSTCRAANDDGWLQCLADTDLPLPGTYEEPSLIGCCSQDYKSCDAEWCSISKERCEACDGQLRWLEDGALPADSCVERWGECTYNKNACCPGGYCNLVAGEGWWKCLETPYIDPSGGNTINQLGSTTAVLAAVPISFLLHLII